MHLSEYETGILRSTPRISVASAHALGNVNRSVPPPRRHTLRYAEVLAGGSLWRARITPEPPEPEKAEDAPAGGDSARGAKLLARSFASAGPRRNVLLDRTRAGARGEVRLSFP